MSRLRLLASALALIALTAAPVRAQIDPSDSGAGMKLGIQELNTSGQVGTVTLFDAGAKTIVYVKLQGAPADAQPAEIARGKDCPSFEPHRGFRLAPTIGGVSRTLVQASSARLLSGNYVVVMYAPSAQRRPVACGYLYQ